MTNATMPQVFISYRQVNDTERKRVYDFATRLRDCKIDVILDQFFLEEHPGGPNEGWDKWSSDRALESDHVIIIGNEAWFQCFEKTQPPGTGLGAACEADDLRHRIYKANGIVDGIRVVSFDSNEAKHIPAKLERYHRFNAEKDFDNIVRWLGGFLTAKATNTSEPRTSIPNNLPRLQPFFGREEELKKIKSFLSPTNNEWGTCIAGDGGMGKTSLAIKAALDFSTSLFDQIVFVSLKSRVLQDDGERDASFSLVSGLIELYNELATELGQADITKAPEEERPKLLLQALRNNRILLVLDNLESLTKPDRNTILNFVQHLPQGCKAILTSREHIGSVTDETKLEELKEDAALATIEELGKRNPLIAKTSIAERKQLYELTRGIPLLLRWTAGQIGRGKCHTMQDAIHYLRSCPKDNDPLAFIFGSLVKSFSAADIQILCTLCHFTLPAKAKHIADITGLDEAVVDTRLHILANLSMVVFNETSDTYTLIPLVGDYLRNEKPEIITETGTRLEAIVYNLVIENGHQNHEKFPVLDVAWPSISAALPIFLNEPNERLQYVCDALGFFLEFTGRWDEWLALELDAEKHAVENADFLNAGWRTKQTGWVYFLRNQAKEVIASAERAERYWQKAGAGNREQAIAIRLRGIGYQLEENYPQAIEAFQKALDIRKKQNPKSRDVAITLNDLAALKRMSGDYGGAEKDYKEGLKISKAINDSESIVVYTGNLAVLALYRKDWIEAEKMAKEALGLSEQLGRMELIGSHCQRLAEALHQQGRNAEGLPYAHRAVETFTKIGSPKIAIALETLARCESPDK